MAKIENLIDEKTFQQFDRLLDSLNVTRNEFKGAITDVAAFNDQLGKIKGFKELDTTAKALEKSLGDLEAAQKKNLDATKKAAKAEDDVVKATKEKIKVSSEELNSINKAGVSLDKYIRLQVRLKAENSQLTKDQRELQKAFEKGAISGDQLSDKLVELTKRQTELKTASSQVNAVVKAYSREADAAEGSSEQLSARLVRLRREWDNLSEAQRENSDTGRELFSQIEDLDTKVKALDESTGRSQRNVGNYKSAFDGLPGPIGEAVGSIQAFSGSTLELTDNLSESEGGFSSMVNGLKAAARAALAFIATPLGATLAGISAALLAARGWFEYNKNIAEATKLTKQLTGLTGNELKSLRAEIQATADTFGKDYKETLIATNSVAKQFGISQTEALDVINKGFIAGADVSGEFLEQLREYPTQLKSIGLSASETAAIITQNVQEGIYSDKGIDAIKEAGIRIRELTPATRAAIEGIGLSSTEIQKGLESGALSMFDVIQKVSGKLNELPENSAAVGTAIADIFGGPGEDAGLNYLKTLQDIDLNLDNIVGQTGDLGEAQQKQLQATEELNKAWATLFDSTGGTFELLIANAKLFATDILIGVINRVIDLTNYFIDLYNEAMLFRAGVQTVKVAFQNLFEFITFSLKRAIDGFKAFGSLFKAIIEGDLQGVKDAFKSGFNDQVDAFKNLGKDIGQNYVDGFNEVVRGEKVARIEKNLGFDSGLASGTGGGAFDEGEAATGTTGAPISFRRLEAEITGVERILDLNKKLEIDTKDGAERVAEFRARMAKQAADAEIAENERALERQKEIEAAKKELFREVADLAISLVNSQFERQTIELQKQEEQIDINKAKEIERINKTVESEEEKAARIAIIEARAQNEREELQRRQAQIQRRQAEFEKAVSIARIIANTASGITAALASVPPNIPLSIIIGAIGAAQIAKIATTPIPQFYKGTDDAPEGLAKVGERGRELRIEPTGEMSLTPAKETLTYLKKGTKIVPAGKTRSFLYNNPSDVNNIKYQNNTDVSKLNSTYKDGVKELKKAFLSTGNKQPSTIITKGGIAYIYKNGNSRQEYLNRNL